MFPDALTRFSGRVANYVRYRPGYPAEIASLFALPEGAQVADIGSGTGLLAKVFLHAGLEVTGIEPNAEMRAAAAGFRCLEGRAEATGLPDASFDLVTAGQAFHWFEPEATRREWNRILKPGGLVALIWNDRLHDTPFMREVEALIDVYAKERDPDGAIRERARGRIAPFFAPLKPRIAEFTHSQLFDFEGFRGRLLSASYMPPEHHADELTEQIRPLFAKHERHGVVSFDYRTVVYYGKLPDQSGM